MSLDSFPRAEAQVTLSRLSHWEKRLEQECELLRHHLKSAEDISNAWGVEEIPSQAPSLARLLETKQQQLAEVRSSARSISSDLVNASCLVQRHARPEPQLTAVSTTGIPTYNLLPVPVMNLSAAAPRDARERGEVVEPSTNPHKVFDTRPPWRPFTNEKSLATHGTTTTELLSPKRLVF